MNEEPLREPLPSMHRNCVPKCMSVQVGPSASHVGQQVRAARTSLSPSSCPRRPGVATSRAGGCALSAARSSR